MNRATVCVIGNIVAAIMALLASVALFVAVIVAPIIVVLAGGVMAIIEGVQDGSPGYAFSGVIMILFVVALIARCTSDEW